jgi:hypothetical protein
MVTRATLEGASERRHRGGDHDDEEERRAETDGDDRRAESEQACVEDELVVAADGLGDDEGRKEGGCEQFDDTGDARRQRSSAEEHRAYRF